MVDVTTFGTTTLKKIMANTLNGVADTNKDTGEKRTITFTSNDDTGVGSSLFFELKVGGTITLNELYFSPEAKIRNIQSNGTGTLIPRSTIDAFLSGNFTLYPTQLVTPMNFGWGPVGNDNIYEGAEDAGVVFSTGGDGLQNLFLINKPIPIDGKVYVEFQLDYPGDSGGVPLVLQPTHSIAYGIVKQDAWTNQPFISGWATQDQIWSSNGCVTIYSSNSDNTEWRWNTFGTNQTFTQQEVVNAGGYLDTGVDWSRAGLKMQLGYDVGNDTIELITFDGPDGDGGAKGIRARFKVTTANPTFDNSGNSYFAITVFSDYPNKNSLHCSITKNKTGYYRGTLTDMVELV